MSLCFLSFSSRLRQISPLSGSLSTVGNVVRTRPGHRPWPLASRARYGHCGRCKRGRRREVMLEQPRDPVCPMSLCPQAGVTTCGCTTPGPDKGAFRNRTREVEQLLASPPCENRVPGTLDGHGASRAPVPPSPAPGGAAGVVPGSPGPDTGVPPPTSVRPWRGRCPPWAAGYLGPLLGAGAFLRLSPSVVRGEGRPPAKHTISVMVCKARPVIYSLFSPNKAWLITRANDSSRED